MIKVDTQSIIARPMINRLATHFQFIQQMVYDKLLTLEPTQQQFQQLQSLCDQYIKGFDSILSQLPAPVLRRYCSEQNQRYRKVYQRRQQENSGAEQDLYPYRPVALPDSCQWMRQSLFLISPPTFVLLFYLCSDSEEFIKVAVTLNRYHSGSSSLTPYLEIAGILMGRQKMEWLLRQIQGVETLQKASKQLQQDQNKRLTRFKTQNQPWTLRFDAIISFALLVPYLVGYLLLLVRDIIYWNIDIISAGALFWGLYATLLTYFLQSFARNWLYAVKKRKMNYYVWFKGTYMLHQD